MLPGHIKPDLANVTRGVASDGDLLDVVVSDMEMLAAQEPLLGLDVVLEELQPLPAIVGSSIDQLGRDEDAERDESHEKQGIDRDSRDDQSYRYREQESHPGELTAGEYRLEITVTDPATGQAASSVTPFVVR